MFKHLKIFFLINFITILFSMCLGYTNLTLNYVDFQQDTRFKIEARLNSRYLNALTMRRRRNVAKKLIGVEIVKMIPTHEIESFFRTLQWSNSKSQWRNFTFLEQYHFYASDNYLNYIRSFPEYETYILKLHEIIHSNYELRYSLRFVPGFESKKKTKRMFTDLIDREANRIKNKISQQKRDRAKAERIEKESEDKTLLINKQNINNLNDIFLSKIDQRCEDEDLIIRNKKRARALARTVSRNYKKFDYSKSVKKTKFKDDYSEVFDYCYGTELDKLLHEELCETREKILGLNLQYSQNIHVNAVIPAISHFTALAKREREVEKAFMISDFCDDLVNVMKMGIGIISGFTISAAKGTFRGLRTACSLEHWKGFVTAPIDLGINFLSTLAKSEFYENEFRNSMLVGDYDSAIDLSNDYCIHSQAQRGAINNAVRETYNTIREMSWEELVENGVALGTMILIDGVALNALSGFVKGSGQAFVKQVNSVMKKGPAATEKYAVEVAGFGKLLLEEGPEVTKKAIDIVKNSPELIKAEGSVVKVVRKVVKSNKESKILKNFSISTKHKKRIVEFTDKQLQKKFKHAPDFGVSVPWNKNAALEYKQTLINFIQEEGTEVMSALYRGGPATYYINKKIGLFVVEIGGRYRSGWKLGINQLRNFLNSGNLN